MTDKVILMDKKSVLIIGHYNTLDTLNRKLPQADEIWSMNQFYKRLSSLKFDKIFQIHKFGGQHSPERYDSHWVKEYNNYFLKTHCDIITTSHFKGLLRQRSYPKKLINKNFSSTIDYMLAYAEYYQYTEITLIGFSLKTDGEYKSQCIPLHLRINQMRNRGCKIICENEDTKLTVDWQNLKTCHQFYE